MHPQAWRGMGQEGLVAAVYTDQCLVWDGKAEHLCPLPGRLLLHGERLVVGDRVTWRTTPQGGVITGVQPRETALMRSAPQRRDRAGRGQVLAANVDQLVAVASLREPPLREGLLDRLLVAADAAGLTALVCLTKTDLASAEEVQAVHARYSPLGLPVLATSMLHPETLAPLAEALTGHTSVLAGHSGTGKTSLLNALLGTDMRVGDIDAVGRGRHTTTTARLLPLPHGGVVIDSPGVREFGLHGIAPQALAAHFPDFRPYVGRCGFRDCLHREEPRCAVHQALEDGRLAPERYRSYRRLLEESS